MSESGMRSRPRPPPQSDVSNTRAYLQPDYPYHDEVLDPRGIREIFRRRRWMILGGFVSVMAVVTGLTFLLPKTYESSASFLVERQEVRTDVPALSMLQRLGHLASRETEIGLIQSRSVIEPVVEEGNLHVTVETPHGRKRPEEAFGSFEAGPNAVKGEYEIARATDGRFAVRDKETGGVLATGGLGEPLEFAGVSARLSEAGESFAGPYGVAIIALAEAVEETRERIDVKAVHRDADLIELTCEARTAEGALWLCKAISASYLRLRSELQQAEASAAAEFLAEQTELTQQRLKVAEDRLAAYVERLKAVALDTRASEEVRQNAALWAEREQIKAERAALVSLIHQIEDQDRGSRKYRDLASFPTFLKTQGHIVQDLVENLVRLDNQRAELAVVRTEEDVALAALDSRIVDTEHQLRSIATGYEQALAAQIASLGQALENSGQVLAAIPVQQIESARLERQVSLLVDLYGFLQTRLQEAEIAKAVELPSVRVVDTASLPFEHSRPNETLNLGLGFVLSLGFGLLLGLWKESTDTSLRDRDAVEKSTGVPVLSMIARLKTPGPIISVPYGLDADGSTALTPKWTQERELTLEAFRALSADLRFLGRGLPNGGIRSVAVTSSGCAEGKTFTSCNLAIARASHGTRTLLVDGDLRGRGVSGFLRLPLDIPGLSDVMTDGAAFSDVVRTLEIGAGKTLYVLPAGSRTSQAAALLESEAFSKLIGTAASNFDFVVVDTPPLNVVADAMAVAACVDSMVVVVRGGVTDRAALELTLQRLGRTGANWAGIVLNDVALPAYYRTYSHHG